VFVGELLPGSLSISSALGGLFNPSGFRYNYAIGGLPFLSGASREFPIVRETAPVRKQQFDNASTPGEQSLDGWWLRSQLSFHGGAGLVYADVTDQDAVNLTRFHSSRNVNVWTQGEVSLLNAADTAAGSPVANQADATEFNYLDGTPAAIYVAASTITVVLAGSVVSSSFSGVTARALQTVASDGAYLYVGTDDGIYAAPITANSGTGFTWAKEYTVAATGKVVHLNFLKQRLMCGVANAIYELAPHPGGAPAALPTAKYTDTDTAMRWLSFAESGTAIYACGNNSIRGSVLKFALSSTGTIPTLTGGSVALQLPSGEVPWSVFGYLGSFLGVGTNKGVRIAIANLNGDLTYGPLLFTSTQPVRGWSGRDRFLWCGVTGGHDGDSGLFRIDLSNEVSDLRFAYASDLGMDGDSGTATFVAHLGSSDVITWCTATDIYIEDTGNKAETGYLRTARIRYGTLEPKIFKLLRVRGPALAGPLSFSVLDQNDSESGNYNFPEGESPGLGDIAINSPSEPQDFVSIKFTLGQDDSVATAGGSFRGYQLKALPATPRQRMIQLPLLCYDFEQDSTGGRHGAANTAAGRLAALEELERAGNSVVLQDFDGMTNTACVIEQVRFTQTAPPPAFSGTGGVILLTLRTI
jgi:hypothetical protein